MRGRRLLLALSQKRSSKRRRPSGGIKHLNDEQQGAISVSKRCPICLKCALCSQGLSSWFNSCSLLFWDVLHGRGCAVVRTQFLGDKDLVRHDFEFSFTQEEV